MTRQETSNHQSIEASDDAVSDDAIVAWCRSTARSIRHFVALVLFVVALTLFALPALVALTGFALAVVACLVVLAVGCIVGGTVAIPALVITPDGVKTIVEAAKERFGYPVGPKRMNVTNGPIVKQKTPWRTE